MGRILEGRHRALRFLTPDTRWNVQSINQWFYPCMHADITWLRATQFNWHENASLHRPSPIHLAARFIYHRCYYHQYRYDGVGSVCVCVCVCVVSERSAMTVQCGTPAVPLNVSQSTTTNAATTASAVVMTTDSGTATTSTTTTRTTTTSATTGAGGTVVDSTTVMTSVNNSVCMYHSQVITYHHILQLWL